MELLKTELITLIIVVTTFLLGLALINNILKYKLERKLLVPVPDTMVSRIILSGISISMGISMFISYGPIKAHLDLLNYTNNMTLDFKEVFISVIIFCCTFLVLNVFSLFMSFSISKLLLTEEKMKEKLQEEDWSVALIIIAIFIGISLCFAPFIGEMMVAFSQNVPSPNFI